MHAMQEGMACEQPFVPPPHDQIDGCIGIVGMELLQDARHQHGIAQEGGLDDEDLFHTATLCSRNASFRLVLRSVLSLR